MQDWIWSARNDCGETGETWATGVDEESLDSGHTLGIDERGKSKTAARQIRLEAEVSTGEEPRIWSGLVSCGGKVRKKVPSLCVGCDGGARHMRTCRGSGTVG